MSLFSYVKQLPKRNVGNIYINGQGLGHSIGYINNLGQFSNRLDDVAPRPYGIIEVSAIYKPDHDSRTINISPKTVGIASEQFIKIYYKEIGELFQKRMQKHITSGISKSERNSCVRDVTALLRDLVDNSIFKGIVQVDYILED